MAGNIMAENETVRNEMVGKISKKKLAKSGGKYFETTKKWKSKYK